jgi:hypothetical protein
MRFLPFIQIIAIVFCGLMSGVLLGDRLGPTYARSALTPSNFITLQQVTHVHYGKVLPKFMGGALAGGLLWLILIRAQRSRILFWLLAVAAIAAAAPPDDLRQIWSTWEKAHTARTIVWVSAFVFEVAALASSRKNWTQTAGLRQRAE